jgi:hypothetical protein
MNWGDNDLLRRAQQTKQQQEQQASKITPTRKKSQSYDKSLSPQQL